MRFLRFREWVWGFIPDDCEIADCCRVGVWGNENIVFPRGHEKRGVIVCDYCSSRYSRGDIMYVKRLNCWITSKQETGGELR